MYSRYALSKICGEKTARTFARRFKNDIYAFRIGNVIEPHEYERDFPAFIEDPASRKRNAWSYIDARDLGQICDLAIKKSGLGFQVFVSLTSQHSLFSHFDLTTYPYLLIFVFAITHFLIS